MLGVVQLPFQAISPGKYADLSHTLRLWSVSWTGRTVTPAWTTDLSIGWSLSFIVRVRSGGVRVAPAGAVLIR
jgi:hypothetical protein